jgi:hypothetical protein
VEHTSRSSNLLHMKASHARISQSDLKTGICMIIGGAHGIIVEFVSS